MDTAKKACGRLDSLRTVVNWRWNWAMSRIWQLSPSFELSNMAFDLIVWTDYADGVVI